MATCSSEYENDEWEIDGVIICNDIRLSIDYGVDGDGPFFRRYNGACFVDPSKPFGSGAQVPDWLNDQLRTWCNRNEHILNDRLAVTEAA